MRVTQGQEPAHLMSLFKGKPMIIHLGGTSRKGGQSRAGNTRLFHIRQSSTRATRAVEVGDGSEHKCGHSQEWPSGNNLPLFLLTQVEPSASKLNTNDVFVLKFPDGLFLWKGVAASEEEMAAAKYICSFLGGSITEISEGKEPGGCLLFINVRTLWFTQLKGIPNLITFPVTLNWLVRFICLFAPLSSVLVCFGWKEGLSDLQKSAEEC